MWLSQKAHGTNTTRFALAVLPISDHRQSSSNHPVPTTEPLPSTKLQVPLATSDVSKCDRASRSMGPLCPVHPVSKLGAPQPFEK